jgi:hypothetical protein
MFNQSLEVRQARGVKEKLIAVLQLVPRAVTSVESVVVSAVVHVRLTNAVSRDCVLVSLNVVASAVALMMVVVDDVSPVHDP